MALVDHDYPKGDEGGNFEKVPDSHHDGVDNLHAIWDSVIYEYTDGPRPPLSSDQFDWFTTEAQKLSDKFPIDEETILDGQFSTWSKENEKIAEETVYPGFSDPVTDEYKEKAIPILE